MQSTRVARKAAALLWAACLSQAFVAPAHAAQDAACRAAHLALVIGNARYPDGEAPPREPEGNAKAVAAALERLGFATSEAENLTHDAMRAALDDFEGKIKRDATAALFFSGYGIQAGGHTYLVPVGTAIGSEQDLKAAGFDLDRIMADMAARGARLRIAIVDAARRSPFERRFRPGGPAGLAAITGTSGAVALYAAVPGATIDEGGAGPNPMVKALVAAMGQPGAMAEEMLQRTRQDTVRASHGAQTPWLSSFLDQDIALMGKECGPARAAVADAVPPKPVPPPPPMQPAPTTEPGQGVLATPLPASSAPSSPIPASPAPAVPAPAVPAPVLAKPLAPPVIAAPVVPPPVVVAPAAPHPPPRVADAIPTAPPAAMPASPPPAAAADEVVSDPARLREIADRLFDQGFDPGDPGSPGMAGAIRSYEQRTGLPVEGTPSSRVLASLRATPAPTPWGAITFAKNDKRWGMSWGGATRRVALADAKTRCGSGDCNDATSFSGHQCGAFALSPVGWSITWREDEALARDAALDLCGRHGTTCHIVGAVCADGSGHVSAQRN